MIFELLYTSAPRGLALGSTGFCTVKATRGIPGPLKQLLESLSSLRGAGGASGVGTSFLAATVGGNRWRILSQIRPAPLDYSQRSNFLAQHLAIPCPVPAGLDPAWLLRHDGLFAVAWDGKVEELPPGKALPSGQLSGAACPAWKRLTGDAGWAGAVAEKLEASKQVTLVASGGEPTADLVSEVLSLIPPRERADFTFSTMYCGLPPGIDCQLRVVAKGSAEHQSAVRGGGFVLELGPQLEVANGGTLVAAARSGQAPWLAPANQPRPQQPAPLASEPLTLAPIPAAATTVAAAWRNEGAQLAPATALPSSLGSPVALPPAATREGGAWLIAAVALSLGILLGGAIVAPFWYSERTQRDSVAEQLALAKGESSDLKRQLGQAASEHAGESTEATENIKTLTKDREQLREKTRADARRIERMIREHEAALEQVKQQANDKINAITARATTAEANLATANGQLATAQTQIRELQGKLNAPAARVAAAPPIVKERLITPLLPNPMDSVKVGKIKKPVKELRIVNAPPGVSVREFKARPGDQWELVRGSGVVGKFFLDKADDDLRFRWEASGNPLLDGELTSLWHDLARAQIEAQSKETTKTIPLGTVLDRPPAVPPALSPMAPPASAAPQEANVAPRPARLLYAQRRRA